MAHWQDLCRGTASLSPAQRDKVPGGDAFKADERRRGLRGAANFEPSDASQRIYGVGFRNRDALKART